MLSSQTTVSLSILALKIAALSNVNVNVSLVHVLQLLTGNIASGKKEGVINGYYKYREGPAETTTFPIGQILALAINSDGKILVGCSIRIFNHILKSVVRSVVGRIS